MRKSLDEVVLERLKAEMRHAGDSANSLARKCRRAGYKTNQTTISAILRGRQSARVETLEKLADVLGIEAWLLLTEPGAIESLMARRARDVRPEVGARLHQLDAPYGPILNDPVPPTARTHKVGQALSRRRSPKR